MRWLVTFLHNDAEYEDVGVDESTLAGVFQEAISRECPVHVIAVEEIPEEQE